jgi:PKD repeat protein
MKLFKHLFTLVIFVSLIACSSDDASGTLPIASFSASETKVDTSQTITFTNTSVDATSYSWDFGDGSSSNSTSPNHQYASPGNYTVTLKATNNSGDDIATQPITVFAYALNNTNLSAGSYDITYLTTAATETINVNGLDIITETTSEGETFQLTVAFAENNTYVVDGQYVLNSLVTVAGEFVSQSTIIVDIDNEIGTYDANNSTMQLFLDETLYDVTLFNANELRLSSSNAYSEDGVDYFETSEIRMVR